MGSCGAQRAEDAASRGGRIRIAGLLAVWVLAVSLTGCGGGDGEDVATTTTPPVDEALQAPDAPVVIAHRGASGDAPEHTFAAYDLALEQGADYVEQDLQLTADGVLVALHDATLDRTARGPTESCTGAVATKTIEQLRECDMGSWFNEAYPDRADPDYVGLAIPTMEEILDRYGTDVRYYIEVKSSGAESGMEEPLVELLTGSGLVDGGSGFRQVIVQSFSPESLRLVRSLAPELPLVQLFVVSGDQLTEALLDDVVAYAVGIGPSSVDVDEALVEAAHARCLAVHPYTVDDPTEMVRLLDVGVDGMFTNVPDVLLGQRAGHRAPLECTPEAAGR